MRFLLTISAGLLLVGCAHSGPRFDRAASLEKAAEDPWEYDNRQMYDLNRKIDKAVLRPTAQVYRAVLPSPMRQGMHNFFRLTGEPGNGFNAALQGKPKGFFRAIDRILVNGVLGMGVVDHASGMGLERQSHDFGQTLAVWGVHSGPFFMMPVMGPSTPRDSFGFLVDFFVDPLNLLEWAYLSPAERNIKLGTRIIDGRAHLIDQGEQMLTGVADEYATIRSAWLQLRRNELYDGNPPIDDDYDDIEPYPEDLPPAATVAPPAPQTGPDAGNGQ